jgi:pyruvate-ferredoxin/flavodoxin oxidoreductase
VQQAGFVGCHHFGLLNCTQPPDEVWDALPRPVQEKIIAKRAEVYAIDAGWIARAAGLAGRTNT